MTAEPEGILSKVYAARDAGAVAALYDRWAPTYDAQMAKAGYRHPAIALALLARHLPKGSAPLLDAGAGTGLVGQWLSIIGYPEVEAMDISEGMLAVARSKGCYTACHRLALGGPLPFADGQFAGVIAVGVFTTGHVGPEGLNELLRISRKGGVLVLTVKDVLWTDGFASHVASDSRARIVELTEPYVSMPGEAAATPSRGVVIQVQ